MYEIIYNVGINCSIELKCKFIVDFVESAKSYIKVYYKKVMLNETVSKIFGKFSIFKKKYF